MNIATGIADLERLLAEVSTDHHEPSDNRGLARPLTDGRQLVDDLDYAQIMKAASYLHPSRHAGR